KYNFLARIILSYSYHMESIIPFAAYSTNSGSEKEQRLAYNPVFSLARTLVQTNNKFNRNIYYEDLDKTESRLVKRWAHRSFLNLINPFIVGYPFIRINPEFFYSFSVSHSLCLAGDLINYDFWLTNQKKGDSYNIYFRQIQTYKKIWPSLGIRLLNFPLIGNSKITLSGDCWNQPSKFDFYTTQNNFGFAIASRIDQTYVLKKNKQFKTLSVYIQSGYKTSGYLPESQFLENGLLLYSGLTFSQR
ncbi:hypothetical protein LC612_43070, partial [Nostoc sp. CHAB 5834]|nr:hypothetical protein [Nostoc sp. CHAB 5834]